MNYRLWLSFCLIGMGIEASLGALMMFQGDRLWGGYWCLLAGFWGAFALISHDRMTIERRKRGGR